MTSTFSPYVNGTLHHLSGRREGGVGPIVEGPGLDDEPA
jgi:hypothetical protein